MTVREKLSTMNTKEKVKFIWYYFKIHIIIALVLIISLSIFIYEKASEKTVYCNVTYIGNYMKDDSFKSIKDCLNNTLLKKNKKYTFDIQCDYLNDNKIDTKSDPGQKIITKISTKSIDIAIVDKQFSSKI